MLIADKLQLQGGANITRGVFFATREQVPHVKLLIKHLVAYLTGSFLIDYMAVGHSPLYYELLMVVIPRSINKLYPVGIPIDF